MKIAIEAQRIFRTNKHGMDFVILECIRELQKLDLINEYYILVSSGEDKCIEETPNFHIIEINISFYPLWEQIGLPRTINKIKPDILHCTSNTAPLFCKVPMILTLHDIIFLESLNSNNKSWYQNMGRIYRRFIVPKILPHCKKIITVSNFECTRIQQALNLPKEQITAVYNGYSNHFHLLKETEDIIHHYIPAEEYLFFLGNTDPKKNTPRILKAYSLYLKQSKKKRPLLIADLKESIIDAILKEQKIENIKPYLFYPGYISNKDLPYLYNGSFAFLYPSLRESFGIPILEAMACGTPVITSNLSAIPEIAGRNAILINPYDEKEIAKAIIQLENDPLFYQSQVTYGLQHVQNFSWKKTAEALLNIYQVFDTKNS